MKSEIKKNFIYNVAYQILVLIIPFITLPYISRVLGTLGVGIYSYTYSIVYYFMIFCMLGVAKYGNRSIAKARDNKEQLSKTFKEIYIMQLITSSIMLVIYIIYLIIFKNEYLRVAILQALYVLSCAFDINWFFFGIEKFKITVTRNTIIKILSLVLVFIFVKEQDDVWIYTLILAGTTLLSQIIIWPFLKKYINLKIKVRFKDIKKHFKNNLKMFLPVIAVAIYTMMDKTMLGIFSGVDEVGIYENAYKIYSVPISIITALGTVMLPKSSNLIANSKNEELKKYIYKSIEFVMFLSIPMALGLMIVAKDFSILFYLIPKEMDNKYIISAYLGAFVNLIMNLIFIPLYGSLGACYGTLVAEVVVAIYQTISVKKELPLKKYIKLGIPFLLKTLFMSIIIYLIGGFIKSPLLKIILQAIVGVIIYFAFNHKYIFNIIGNINFLKRKKD